MKYTLSQKIFLKFNGQPKEGLIKGVFSGADGVLTYNVLVDNTEIGVTEDLLFESLSQLKRINILKENTNAKEQSTKRTARARK